MTLREDDMKNYGLNLKQELMAGVYETQQQAGHHHDDALCVGLCITRYKKNLNVSSKLQLYSLLYDVYYIINYDVRCESV